MRHAVIALFLTLLTASAAYGAKANVQDHQPDASLISAIIANTPQVVAELIAHGADVNVLDGVHGLSALEIAARSGQIENVRALVRAGANVKYRDKSGNPVLYWAGSKDVYEFLVAHGAAGTMTADQWWIKLHSAIQAGDLELAESIVTHGGDANAVDKNGTPLLDTVRRDDAKDLLIRLGAKLPAETGDRAIRVRDAKACQLVADRANAGTLDALKLPFVKPDNMVERLLHKQHLEGRVVQVNLTGDELLYAVLSDSPEREPKVTYLRGNGNVLAIRKQRDFRWGFSRLDGLGSYALLNIEGMVYKVHEDGNNLRYLSRVRKDNVEIQVCEFGQREPAIETLVQSSDEAMCKDALDGKLTYANAHVPVSLESRQFYSAKISYGFGDEFLVDINNDGIQRHVFRTYNPAGLFDAICNNQGLVVASPDLALVDQTLTTQLRGSGCLDTTQTPFFYRGAWYVEEKYGSEVSQNYHEVRQLKSGHMETICKFDVRPTHVAYFGNKSLHVTEGKGLKPIVYALSLPGLDDLWDVLDAGALTKGSMQLEHLNRTVMDQAIIDGQDNALTMFLEHGLIPHTQSGTENVNPDEQLDSLFSTAIRYGTPRSVKILLERGANPNADWVTNELLEYPPRSAEKSAAIGRMNLPLFDVPLSHQIMRPFSAVPRASFFQTALG